eukprot:11212980-Lingulodinium_polyedra.AAC.1
MFTKLQVHVVPVTKCLAMLLICATSMEMAIYGGSGVANSSGDDDVADGGGVVVDGGWRCFE